MDDVILPPPPTKDSKDSVLKGWWNFITGTKTDYETYCGNLSKKASSITNYIFMYYLREFIKPTNDVLQLNNFDIRTFFLVDLYTSFFRAGSVKHGHYTWKKLSDSSFDVSKGSY